MAQNQTAATRGTQRLRSVPVSLGVEFVRGMSPAHIIVVTQTEKDLEPYSDAQLLRHKL